MSDDVLCRTCARPGPRLLTLFARPDRRKRYALALQLATGLQIKMNDGLPQVICTDCTHTINTLLKFRRDCHRAQAKFTELGFRRKTTLVCVNELSPHTEQSEATLTHIKVETPSRSCSASPLNYDFDDRIKVEVEVGEAKDKYEQTELPARDYNKMQREAGGDVLKSKLQEDVPLHLLWRLKPPKNKLVLDKFLDKLSPPYTCKVCRKVYKQSGSFVDHTLVHTGYEFMCERCGKVFRNAAKLLRHQRSLHGAERDSKLQCSYCDFHALDQVRLKEHTRTHTGERPFVCDACGAGFTGRELLIQHLTVHITERSVQCDQCPAKFRTRKCLNTHRSKRHRPRLWRFLCPYCPNVYSVFNNCRCHVRKAHGIPHQQQRTPIKVPAQL